MAINFRKLKSQIKPFKPEVKDGYIFITTDEQKNNGLFSIAKCGSKRGHRDMKSNVLRFDYWFSFNYKRLRSILGWQLNEDVFHDTYLLLRKDLLFIDLPIIDFEPLFWGIYKRARLRNIAKENHTTDLMKYFSS